MNYCYYSGRCYTTEGKFWAEIADFGFCYYCGWDNATTFWPDYIELSWMFIFIKVECIPPFKGLSTGSGRGGAAASFSELFGFY